MRAADGSYRWFLCRALPARDAEGRIVRWAASLVDIDDWRGLRRRCAKAKAASGNWPNPCRSLSGPVEPMGGCDYFSRSGSLTPASLKSSNWASVGYSNFIPTTASQPSRLGIGLWRPASL